MFSAFLNICSFTAPCDCPNLFKQTLITQFGALWVVAPLLDDNPHKKLKLLRLPNEAVPTLYVIIQFNLKENLIKNK